ncbi:hypothetical protein like AT2G22180 [Hibiscus trionum]|uniref:Late embryogenesis abundant protein LEA-2 subgroup domain-containing protein n=1 Tax=Hibiscus trionum TaxID=183268 RepID=A0A9W7GZG6_HIBTR|nr:hypothetical protein like AT2G22180 [Hibiscus trionum]
MEERVAYTVGDNPQSRHNDVSPQLLLPPPPGHHLSSAFVVQVPKDQVYRVPPPEHAQIVEKHRMEAVAKKTKRKVPCLKYLFCLFIVLLVIALLIGAAVAVVFYSFKPKAPAFSVSSVAVKQNKGNPPTYDVRLKIKNPNPKMGVKYTSEGDDSKLSFGTKTIGWGRFPNLEHEKGYTADVINMKFHGDKGKPLPASMNDTRAKNPVSLTLDIESPVVFNVWILKLWRKDMEVKCEFRVDTMGEGTKILDQDCNTKLF